MNRSNSDWDEHYKFILNYFPEETIFERFTTIWSEVKHAFTRIKRDGSFIIDVESFRMFILDYFTDIARLKHFHNIDLANTNKIYSYTLYWFLRRHPIQIPSPTIGYFDINERIGFAITLPKILVNAGIDVSKIDNCMKEQTNKFVNLFLYNLRYRQYNAQSLEFMIESFYLGLTLGEHYNEIKL